MKLNKKRKIESNPLKNTNVKLSRIVFRRVLKYREGVSRFGASYFKIIKVIPEIGIGEAPPEHLFLGTPLGGYF